MHVFASCSSYTLGQVAGPRQACALINAACTNLDHELILPAVHALRELRALADVELRVDGGATSIPKSRSRHFFAALQSSADVWFTIDDDIDSNRETLALLLAAVSYSDEPRICFAPYVLRSDPTVAAVEWSPVYAVRTVVAADSELPTRPSGLPPDGLARSVVVEEAFHSGEVKRAIRGGFGLVAMNRTAMTRVAQAAPSFRDDADGQMKPAVFLEYIDGRAQWLGEDFAFFERARNVGINVEGLITGETTHAGVRLDLGALK